MAALTPERYDEWIARYRTGTYAVDHDVVMRDARFMLAAVDELCDEKSRLQQRINTLEADARVAAELAAGNAETPAQPMCGVCGKAVRFRRGWVHLEPTPDGHAVDGVEGAW